MRSIHFVKDNFQESCKRSMAVSVGDTVEVCSEEEGFIGAYYVARVIAKKGKSKLLVEYATLVTEEDDKAFLKEIVVARVLAKKDKNKPLVEYAALVTEEDDKAFLKEIVDACMVRPLPPEMRVSKFSVLEKVDAYDNDGWWEGRITKKNDSNYSLYFETTGDLIEYPSFRLRPHQEYVN